MPTCASGQPDIDTLKRTVGGSREESLMQPDENKRRNIEKKTPPVRPAAPTSALLAWLTAGLLLLAGQVSGPSRIHRLVVIATDVGPLQRAPSWSPSPSGGLGASPGQLRFRRSPFARTCWAPRGAPTQPSHVRRHDLGQHICHPLRTGRAHLHVRERNARSQGRDVHTSS
ncbi:hypothetical protein Vafri_3516 [Volvox africanus]|uniref:Uncharacterized protein n=1 Tax=Volvox africanus TaxID=51714 RepID=A0A8J4AUH3_9CHLO|nr:hypothetical protein Vafri_3516 [Volvox africanus]